MPSGEPELQWNTFCRWRKWHMSQRKQTYRNLPNKGFHYQPTPLPQMNFHKLCHEMYWHILSFARDSDEESPPTGADSSPAMSRPVPKPRTPRKQRRDHHSPERSSPPESLHTSQDSVHSDDSGFGSIQRTQNTLTGVTTSLYLLGCH